jgi:AcrR family transcriptional regulator
MAKIKKSTRKPLRARVSKQDWISAALETLATSGIESVKVERLAKQLGVAKSGFYWHFKNRYAFLKELLRYWEEEYTGVVIAEARLKELSPRDRLLEIVRMIHKHELNKYDLSFQAWATSDVMARETVSRVMDLRLGFLRETFRELGLSGDELEMRTMLFVAYHSWEATTFSHIPTRKLKRLVKRRIDLLCEVG